MTFHLIQIVDEFQSSTVNIKQLINPLILKHDCQKLAPSKTNIL